MISKYSRISLPKTFLVLLVLCMILADTAEAKPQTQLYSTISMDMYVLDPGTGSRVLPLKLCNTDDNSRKSYGCTAYPGDATRKYPFNSNSITINVESDIQFKNGENVQLGYLHSVTPAEVAITVSSQGNKPLSCVKAQAVAARTFAYYHIQQGANINNSTDYQVYVPYRHHTLTSAQQQRVDNAVSEVLYMTASGSTDPIRAHFGADNDTTTTDGGESYLKSIYDPISHLGTDYGTSNGGMSSRGCSRWGFGHTSSRGPVAPDHSNYPGDSNGDGDFWSIRYDNAKQILTQYYTDIAIRNSSGQIVTPASRWNPLFVDWGSGSFEPPPMMSNGLYYVVIQLHNSGATAYTNGTLLSYQWQGPGGTTNGATSVAVGSITEGNFTTVTLPVRAPNDSGLYTLRIDMVHQNGGYFHDRETGRPWVTLDFAVCVGNQCNVVFLPIVFNGNGSSGPGNCQWTIDNLLQDGGFNNLPHAYWDEINVFDSNPNQKPLDTLRTTAKSWPGDSPWSAVLGGVNDTDADGDYQEDHELLEHAVFQMISFPAGVEQVSLEYSYYLTTEESPSSSTEWDKFFVDLQIGGLGLDNSLLGQPVKYANTHPYKDVWRRRGDAVADGGDGYLIVDDMEQYAGTAIYAVFYSEVDTSNISTFYIDAVKLKGCTIN